MTTNGPESLNNVFKEARLLPVTAIVEITFYKCVKYFSERRKEAEIAVQGHLLHAPKVAQWIEKKRTHGNKHNVKSFREQQKYEITTPQVMEGTTRKGGRKHTVRINTPGGVCTCMKPQLTGMACSHIFAACGYSGVDSNQFIHSYYKATTLLQTWSPEFNGFGNPDEWPIYEGPTLIPDPTLYKVSLGRRKTIRIRNEMDTESTQKNAYTCKKCGQSGHSRRTCTTPSSVE